MTETIRAHFQSAKPWPEAEKPIQLLKLLDGYADVGLSPTGFGSSERRTSDLRSLQELDIVAAWRKVGGGILKSPKPWSFVVHVFYVKTTWARAISSLWLHLSEDYFTKADRTNRFLELCKEVFAWGRMDHGFVAREVEYKTKNELGPGAGVGGPNLKVALPGVYWANFFGPVYVEWFGRHKFEALEVPMKERLENGGWLLLTREDPIRYDSGTAQRTEEQVIRQLDRNAFFEMRNPRKKTETPDLFKGR